MRRCSWLGTVLLVLLPFMIKAQGSIVLAGGGSESEGGWSDMPYQWIVDHAANKRIAVISYTDEDNWIPDYFVSLGAVEAKNIRISTRTTADLQSTYDELMSYDGFFFKGGDQSVYYSQYKDTKTMQAAIDKFNAGGVMSGTSAGMAILTGIIYTAEKGSAYPDETIANVYDDDVTLANDFLPFLPGFLGDSHFTERGRVGRLLPFMARWFLDHDELITGIGVDDRTALCIAPDNKATVFGTGTVSFYSGQTFGVVQDQKPVADSIHVTQLLHGHRIDLNTLQIISGPAGFITPEPADESGNYVVLLSGSNALAQNADLLNSLVKEHGAVSDTVVVVTAPGKGKTFTQKIKDLGGGTLVVETSAAQNDAGKLDLRNSIRKATKILFVENDDNQLFDFLNGGPTGMLLYEHIRRNGIVSAFAGEDSRYAGRSFCANHRQDQYAAYYGRLTYRKGLRLLPSSTIMANTFDPATTDFYENTTAAVSYAMVADSTRYGIYLNQKNTLNFYQQSGRNYFKAGGSQSVFILTNAGSEGELASVPVSTGGLPRNYSGFSAMHYVLLSGALTLRAGIPVVTDDPPYEFEYPVVGVESESDQSSFQVFPNPSASGIFRFSENEVPEGAELSVVDMMGRTLVRERMSAGVGMLDISSAGDGMYMLRIKRGAETICKKLIKAP